MIDFLIRRVNDMKVQFLMLVLFSALNHCSQHGDPKIENPVLVRKTSTNWQQRCSYEKRVSINATPKPEPCNLNFTLLSDPCDGPFIALRYRYCQGYADLLKSEHNEMDLIKYLYTAEILNALPVHFLDFSGLHCNHNQDEVVQDLNVLAEYENLEALRVGQISPNHFEKSPSLLNEL
jgi:hypothetical protein